MRKEKINALHILFHRMGSLRERFFYQVSEGFIIPVGQSRVMHCLAGNGEIVQNRLAELMEIRPGSLSELLAKLEKNGYVERTKSSTDRRKIIVRLTQKGRKISAFHHQAHLNFFGKMFQELSDAELEELYNTLEKLVGSWEKMCKDDFKDDGSDKRKQNT